MKKLIKFLMMPLCILTKVHTAIILFGGHLWVPFLLLECMVVGLKKDSPSGESFCLSDFYIILSSQHSGTFSPKIAATVGATFASPKLPSLMVYLVLLS